MLYNTGKSLLTLKSRKKLFFFSFHGYENRLKTFLSQTWRMLTRSKKTAFFKRIVVSAVSFSYYFRVSENFICRKMNIISIRLDIIL